MTKIVAGGNMARRNVVTPTVLGLNAVTTASTRTSEPFDITSWERMRINVEFDGDATPATSEIQLAVQVSHEHVDSVTKWFPLQTTTWAAGTGTMQPLSIIQAIAAGASPADENYPILVKDLCDRSCRLVFTFTNGNADDAITVTVLGGDDN